MKKLLMLSTIVSTYSYSQGWKDSIQLNQSGDATYELIFEQTGTKQDLFSKTKIWIAEVSKEFYESKYVIQTEDKEEGYIIVNTKTLYSHDHYKYKKKKIEKGSDIWTDFIEFTIKFFFKENKVKVIVLDVVFPFANLPFLNESFNKEKIEKESLKLTSIKEDEIADGMTWKEKFLAAQKKIQSLLSSYKTKVAEKSENDF